MSLDTNPIGAVSLPASADLSTKQFYFVKVDTAGRIALAVLGDFAIGVLYSKPNAIDVLGSVQPLLGKVKVIAGTTIAKGDLIKSDVNGKAGVAVKGNGAGITGSNVLGVAIDSAVAGDIFQILASPSGAVPTTLA